MSREFELGLRPYCALSLRARRGAFLNGSCRVIRENQLKAPST